MGSIGAQQRVFVVGAGIVGVSTALRLLMDGFDVCLVDRETPMHGCSAGNAGYLTEANIFPPLGASVLKRLPALLFDRGGPLVMDWRYLHKMLPWSWRALAASRTPVSVTIQAALGGVSRRAIGDFKPLLAEAGAQDLVSQEGSLVVFRQRQALFERASLIPAWRAQGIEVVQVGAETVYDMEPALAPGMAGAIYYPNSARCLDPQALGLRYLDRFLALGGKIYREEVRHVAQTGVNEVMLTMAEGTRKGHAVVISAGYWSAALLEQHGLTVPLASERGYHCMLPHETGRLSRPVVFGEPYFAATPMMSGLRLAGTAEFAYPDSPARMARARHLAGLARQYLPHLQEADAQHWMGVRPSFPDGQPAIGRLAQAPRVLYAFGHGHCGLTYSATTAQCVRDMLRDAEPALDLAPFALERFSA